MQNKIDPLRAYHNVLEGASSPQQIHMGKIVERMVRRGRMGISELARRLNVSRRTLYNWFQSERISIEVVRRIGRVTGHDFSADFPHEFEKRSDFADGESLIGAPDPGTAVYYWMDKYIKLLEKFNVLLSRNEKFKGLVILLGEFLLITENPLAAIN